MDEITTGSGKIKVEDLIPQKVAAMRAANDYEFNKEFNRYKQDCRKRAMDMAHQDLLENKLAPNVTIEIAANEYYNWLILIE